MRSRDAARYGVATIQACGYITAANASQFQEDLSATVNSSDHSAFLVDMQQVEFLDSAGLMALVWTLRLSQSLGKRFSLCCLAPSVRIIFEVTQLDKAFEIFDSREEFSASLHSAFMAEAA